MTFEKKNILIGVLDWGLGHATRMIPIINYLKNKGHSIIIVGNGNSFKLLKKHFDTLNFIEFDGPNIRYSLNNRQNQYLIFQTPKYILKLWLQKFKINRVVRHFNIQVIISDNRFYFRNKKCTNIYVTHQVFPQIGNINSLMSLIARKIHLNIIKKYEYCLVPDIESTKNISGVLSHGKIPNNVKYIGLLSRFNKIDKFDIKKKTTLVVISGPEPQRSIFENLIVSKFKHSDRIIYLVRGTDAPSNLKYSDNIVKYDFIDNSELLELYRIVETIICRSGYSSIMDLVAIGRKAILVPTPGQYEQEYLADFFKTNYNFTVLKQDELISCEIENKSSYFSEVEITQNFSEILDFII